MRVCKGCDHTRPVPIFSGHVCVSTEYTGLMWRGVLSALGSLWRQNQDIGTELKSCQKHWNWFSLTMPDLPSVVRCFCSAADLLFLFFGWVILSFLYLLRGKAKCTLLSVSVIGWLCLWWTWCCWEWDHVRHQHVLSATAWGWAHDLAGPICAVSRV